MASRSQQLVANRYLHTHHFTISIRGKTLAMVYATTVSNIIEATISALTHTNCCCRNFMLSCHKKNCSKISNQSNLLADNSQLSVKRATTAIFLCHLPHLPHYSDFVPVYVCVYFIRCKRILFTFRKFLRCYRQHTAPIVVLIAFGVSMQAINLA